MKGDYNYIAMDDLVVGGIYEVAARNFTVGLWTGEGFVGIRHKFNSVFLDEELHYDTGAPYGTTFPYRLIVMLDGADPVILAAFNERDPDTEKGLWVRKNEAYWDAVFETLEQIKEKRK